VFHNSLIIILVLFGEHHEQSSILKAQLCVLEGMASQAEQHSKEKQNTKQSIVLVLEMFNFQQQLLLDAFQNHEISMKELDKKYQGTEGFAIMEHYGYLIDAARSLGIKVIGGFVPRSLGRTIIDDGKEATLKKIRDIGGPVEDFYIDGSENHYRYFQGLISGDMDQFEGKYRRIFPAQILKDSFFAHTVTKIVESSEDTKVVGICGSGHIDYGFGVPERISRTIPVLLLTSRMKEDKIEPDIADFIYQY
jgi:uncharacterized iron-regulated protein